jgi:glutamine synthetase
MARAAKGTSNPAVVEAIRKSGATKVKVAVSDIDGILRGKYIHRDKFFSAVDSGFGFCDVLFGCDMHDQCYDNTRLTGWHHGFPDATVRIDLATHHNVRV